MKKEEINVMTGDRQLHILNPGKIQDMIATSTLPNPAVIRDME
jgi:hypothetical protein